MKISELYSGDTNTIRSKWAALFDRCASVEAFMLEVRSLDRCYSTWVEKRA